MLNALRDLFASKKFQTFLIGILVTAGAKIGLEVSDELAAAVLAVVAILIGAQGAADVGKEAAKARSGERGVSLLGFMLGCVLVGLTVGVLLGSLGGCTKTKGVAGRIAGDVVDCMTPAAQSAIGELGPAFGNVVRNATSDDGTVDWAQVRAAAAPLNTHALQ